MAGGRRGPASRWYAPQAADRGEPDWPFVRVQPARGLHQPGRRARRSGRRFKPPRPGAPAPPPARGGPRAHAGLGPRSTDVSNWTAFLALLNGPKPSLSGGSRPREERKAPATNGRRSERSVLRESPPAIRLPRRGRLLLRKRGSSPTLRSREDTLQRPGSDEVIFPLFHPHLSAGLSRRTSHYSDA
jgi:hypothetical protein